MISSASSLQGRSSHTSPWLTSQGSSEVGTRSSLTNISKLSAASWRGTWRDNGASSSLKCRPRTTKNNTNQKHYVMASRVICSAGAGGRPAAPRAAGGRPGGGGAARGGGSGV